MGQITKLTLGFHREGEYATTSEVRASAVINDILTLYAHRIEPLGICIEKRYDSAEVVVANAGELRQVLTNLIVNACEALAEKGNKLFIHVYDSRGWKAGERGHPHHHRRQRLRHSPRSPPQAL